MAARTGKIARLPWAVRQALNQRLLDGQPGPEVLAWLNALPDVGESPPRDGWQSAITDGNLSEWRAGGYAEWVKQTLDVERMQRYTDLARRLQDASGGSPAGIAADIAAGKILEVLVDDATAGCPDGESSGPDIVGAAIALAKLRAAETMDRRVALDVEKFGQSKERLGMEREKLDQDRQRLEMQIAKWQREMAGAFLDWYEDDRARRIAESAGSRGDKVAQLSLLADLYFGAPPADNSGPQLQ